MKTSNPKLDVYARVTDRIISTLETGTRPWLKPWSATNGGQKAILPLRADGTPYRGINVLLLWGEAMDKGYTLNTWMTYRQAEDHGAQVRKGEKGSMVVYANRASSKGAEDNDEGEEKGERGGRGYAFMRAYTVFNVEQIDGLPESFYAKPAEPEAPRTLEMIEDAEAFFAGTGASIRHGGNRAFYSTAGDFIELPPLQAFRDVESYTATKAHEIVHWSGHPSRMDRIFGKRFGDQAYAFEELVAELGSAFLCATLGITSEPREDHAAYLASWLGVLRDDKRAIFTAAALAQRAVDYLEGLQRSEAAKPKQVLEAA